MNELSLLALTFLVLIPLQVFNYFYKAKINVRHNECLIYALKIRNSMLVKPDVELTGDALLEKHENVQLRNEEIYRTCVKELQRTKDKLKNRYGVKGLSKNLNNKLYFDYKKAKMAYDQASSITGSSITGL